MLWTCLECSTRYALDLRACPHCQSHERTEDGVAKITRHGGPSDARDIKTPEDNVVSDDEGSEQSSPGTRSSASTPKTPSTPAQTVTTRRRRARTTESPSSLDPEANSSASSTTTTSGPVTGGSSDADAEG